ncbi:MAG: MerR family transcriptional regulator [Bacillota bacterium]
MYTIGQLCKRFCLSRSTLLYYDSIGLLKASKRTDSNYRKYSEDDVKRLETICTYRQAGVPLEDIKRILNAQEHTVSFLLEKRLNDLNEGLKQIRNQQQIIVKLLKNEELSKKVGMINKESWVSLLRAAGLTDDHMDKWHAEFEKMSPNGHQEFLESLGIPDEEIKGIRGFSRNFIERDEKVLEEDSTRVK